MRRGQSVLVYDRDRPVARTDPVREPGFAGADHVAELLRVGAVRPPAVSLSEGWLERRVAVKADVVEALLAEREAGR